MLLPHIAATGIFITHLFCLDHSPDYDLRNDFVDGLNLKPGHSFPEAKNEDQHMMTLFKALLFYFRDHDADVQKIENPGNTDHYCEFSGGGDLFIKKKSR